MLKLKKGRILKPSLVFCCSNVTELHHCVS